MLDPTARRSALRTFALRVSIFFFLAFMMFGSVAYRGSFSRRSAVTTPGSLKLTVSRPPSTCKAQPAWM